MYTKFISVKKIVHKKKFKKNSAQKNHEKNYCTEFIRKKNCAQKKKSAKKKGTKKNPRKKLEHKIHQRKKLSTKKTFAKKKSTKFIREK